MGSQVEKFTAKPRTPQTLNPGFSIETHSQRESVSREFNRN